MYYILSMFKPSILRLLLFDWNLQVVIFHHRIILSYGGVKCSHFKISKHDFDITVDPKGFHPLGHIFGYGPN